MFRAGAGLLALSLFVAWPAAAAPRCGPAMVQITVLDQGGSALSGLSPADFKVRIKGQNANITAVDFGVFPHSTLLLVSRDGSMAQSNKLELARQLAGVVVAGAPGTVMTGTFGSDVSGLADGRSGQAFASPLQAGADDRNALYDAINAGMASMKLHQGDEVVVITDSPDTGSKTAPRDLQGRFAATGVRLFVVALPPASGLATMQPLAALAEGSGGAVLVPVHVETTTNGVVITPAQIEGAVTNLTQSYTQYNNIYQLETDVDGQERELPLRVEVDHRKLGAGKVIAPAMLAPCTAFTQ